MRNHKIAWPLVCLLCICVPLADRGQQVAHRNGSKAWHTGRTAKRNAAAPPAMEPPAQATQAPGAAAQTSPQAPVKGIPRWLQPVKVWVELLAYVLAFLFFLYKLYQGQFTTNLALSLSCKRVRVTNYGGEDHLAVVVTIRRGETGPLVRPLWAEVRVVGVGGEKEQVLGSQNLDMRRFEDTRSALFRIFKIEILGIQWGVPKGRWPTLNFPPSDASQFACLFGNIPPAEPCRVDFIFVGKARFPKIKTGQWRASDISLPLGKHEQAASEAAPA